MSTSSRAGAATSCTPMGTPPSLWPSGSDTAGWPVMLNTAVKATIGVDRRRPASGLSGVAANCSSRR